MPLTMTFFAQILILAAATALVARPIRKLAETLHTFQAVGTDQALIQRLSASLIFGLVVLRMYPLAVEIVILTIFVIAIAYIVTDVRSWRYYWKLLHPDEPSLIERFRRWCEGLGVNPRA